ncbi:MAG TPA: sugar transferase [Gemmatimonadaceae bacterium]|nr:sugar transferase [Gemmatimonadaceae bacterium]
MGVTAKHQPASELEFDPSLFRRVTQPDGRRRADELDLGDGIDLNARAFKNIRTHFRRSAVRITVLLLADSLAFLALRTVLRAMRNAPWAGEETRALVNWLFAQGYLGGLQFAAALLVGLVVMGTYRAGDYRHDTWRLFLASALGVALPLWPGLWGAEPLLTVGRYALTLLAVWTSLAIVRTMVELLVRKFSPRRRTAPRTILVGSSPECMDMHRRPALLYRYGLNVLGYVDVEDPASSDALGSLRDLERVVHDHQIDTVVLCGFGNEDTVLRVVHTATRAECEVLAVDRMLEMPGLRPGVVWRRGQPLLGLRAVALRGQQLLVKRLLDVVVSAVALVITSPLMLLIAIAIRLDSPGPIVFSQRRTGRHGRVFNFFKFRSMCMDAELRLLADRELLEQYVENGYKVPRTVDTRVTRVGRFLRRTSLDELPQLWNVLRGDMSLVGPRPIVPDQVRHYYGSGDAPLLLCLKPGITGAWQVSGRSTIQYPERANLELDYVQGWSLMRDLRILAQTIPAVLSQRGAH